MSAKNRDGHGRWRCITIAFRVSPEENEEITKKAELSGLTKQEYISCRCREKEIVVIGNPKVYRALKTQIADIYQELCRISSSGEQTPEFWEVLRTAEEIIHKMKE